MKLNYLRVRLREHFVNPQLLKQLAVYKIKEEHLTDDCKVIDAALKYGYDSPDSFTKAFTRFHGITLLASGENNRHGSGGINQKKSKEKSHYQF